MRIKFRTDGEIVGDLDYCRSLKKGDVINLEIQTISGTGSGTMRLYAAKDPVKTREHGWVVDVTARNPKEGTGP